MTKPSRPGEKSQAAEGGGSRRGWDTEQQYRRINSSRTPRWNRGSVGKRALGMHDAWVRRNTWAHPCLFGYETELLTLAPDATEMASWGGRRAALGAVAQQQASNPERTCGA